MFFQVTVISISTGPTVLPVHIVGEVHRVMESAQCKILISTYFSAGHQSSLAEKGEIFLSGDYCKIGCVVNVIEKA